jgi:NAD(P)-dependent dehydrogenase (short-subunit alcohol dehydrogenase family)
MNQTMGCLEGKSVIVTGAARGLGRAYALDAAREGAAVLVNDLSDDVAAVAREIVEGGGKAVAHVGSVTTWDGAQEIVDNCLKAFGRLDGLVNNAGVIHKTKPHEETEAQAVTAVTVNLLGAIFVGTHALKVMAEQRSGSVVNVTSSAQMGIPDSPTYAATKGGVASLTYSWAVDMSLYGVRVNGFAPSAWGHMQTIMKNPVSQGVPTPEANAPVVTYLLSDLSEGITSQVVQMRGADVVLVRHPSLSDHIATSEHWTAESLATQFGPVLKANLEPLGWEPALVGMRLPG